MKNSALFPSLPSLNPPSSSFNDATHVTDVTAFPNPRRLKIQSAICHLPSAIPVHVCSPHRRPIRAGGRKLTFARLREALSLCNIVTFVTLVTASAFVTGCQVLSYQSPSGEKFVRSSFGANTTIQSLAVEAGTNGVRRVELRGYQNESTQALSAVTDAAVKAALTAVKP